MSSHMWKPTDEQTKPASADLRVENRLSGSGRGVTRIGRTGEEGKRDMAED